ncbi:MAG: VWA domain-containing protein [Proteobacteria bacterium]|nr:VWA domain-containing protein [Pseudomonadota bacterium]
MRNRIPYLILILVLAVATLGAMEWMDAPQAAPSPQPVVSPVPVAMGGAGPVSVTGRLVADKIPPHGTQAVDLCITLTAEPEKGILQDPPPGVDLVVVLDVSGSMSGDKITDAKAAVLALVRGLTDRDRFALVAYSDRAWVQSPMNLATPLGRERMEMDLADLNAGGSTNLSEGLETGMGLLTGNGRVRNLGKLVLVSDGQANRGVTDTGALCVLAEKALSGEFAVSSVGVGLDFNETLMASLADHGGGTYRFLSDPEGFYAAFAQELNRTRSVAATGLSVHVPLPAGVRVADAGGYPVTVSGNEAVFHPGDILHGQTRTLYVTLEVSDQAANPVAIPGVRLGFRAGDQAHEAVLDQSFTIARADTEAGAWASLDRESWEKKVSVDSFGLLRQEVATSVAGGNYQEARDKIQEYRRDADEKNAVVQSPAVTRHLEEEVSSLEAQVGEMADAPAKEQSTVRKAEAKRLQYEGYKDRRSY